MEKQNYNNHIRWYWPHHFLFYGVILAASALCVAAAFKFTQQYFEWIAIAVCFAVIGALSLMLRQHYALGNQDRIVRLEMRLRYYILTGKRFEMVEERLSLGQICALRFAGDEELPGLVNRALLENLTADDIKKAVTNWQADNMRR